MTPLLSILIPSVEGRMNQRIGLINTIIEQVGGVVDCKGDTIDTCTIGKYWSEDIEIIIAIDNKQISIGEKRQLLHEQSTGKYIWSIDDDDSIAPDAISLILSTIRENPDVDCITFQERVEIDGVVKRSNHSLAYEQWGENIGGMDYVRTPFFKSVIKREIALQVPVAEKRYAEDIDWAERIYPLLKTEVHIPQQLYLYQHISSPFTERYGITQ